MEPVNDQRLYSNRYQVTHLIARGGMAMVYRAQDTLLNRPVALKILYPELSADPLFVERFRREAQAAANLSHPNIVPVFDWGADAGTYFIVMELIEGTSLDEVLRATRVLSPARAVNIATQVAAALGYAHRSGVVHRDVKPGNILITSDNQVKVTDFGIAQAVSSEDQLVVEGSVMGTATYFSPEQAEGAVVDGRSDVYSLGVVLFQMVCGRPPFIGDTPVEVSSQHVNSVVPSPTTFKPDVPNDLDAIIMHALAKSPGQRYQSADEFRADLLRFSEGRPVQASERNNAFFGADATRAVAAVTPGERTQAVPVMSGPRTDVKRRNSSRRPLIVSAVVVLVLAIAGLGYLATASKGVTTMPNITGESIEKATATLTGDGLVVGTTKQVSSSKRSGTVLSSDPRAGSHISKGESVSLTVSLGHATAPVTVPDLTGMTLSDAESELQTELLGFTIEFTPTVPVGQTAAPNTVLSQTPVGGTQSTTGSKITLVVLAPNSKYPMPNLAGDTTLQAASTLGQSGLTVSTSTATQCSNQYASGLVVATSPAQSTLVSAGQAVELITSSGYCNVIVPTVTGETQSQAQAALTAPTEGLIPSYTPAPASECSPENQGTVLAQSVPGGSSVLYDSTITLTVCTTGIQ